MPNINQLITLAAQINADYRIDDSDRTGLDAGFLAGTAELIITLTGLLPDESYSDKRDAIMEQIDREAVTNHGAYSIL